MVVALHNLNNCNECSDGCQDINWLLENQHKVKEEPEDSHRKCRHCGYELWGLEVFEFDGEAYCTEYCMVAEKGCIYCYKEGELA